MAYLHSFTHHSRRGHSATLHLVLSVLALLSILATLAFVLVVAFLKAGPTLDRSRLDLRQSVRILDRRGGTLYQFSSGENRLFLQSDGIPDRVKKAVVAIEDERFFDRWTCIDIRAVIRAFKANTLNDDRQGASTITQQLTRMLYLTRERTITRKLYEILLACRLEHLLTRDEILTLYLNGVSFGNGLNGIEAASKVYLGIPAKNLSLAQTAVLVAIPQRPTYFSPYGPHLRSTTDPVTLRALRLGTLTGKTLDPASVTTGLIGKFVQGKGGLTLLSGRADFVLRSMLRLGSITQSQFTEASGKLQSMTFIPLSHPINAPHFSLSIREEIESLLQSVESPQQWEAAGITVHTTLDPLLQDLAESTVSSAQEILRKAGAKNAALVAIDRRTRQVVAYVGNNDFFVQSDESQFDMARVPRQPGSSFKPLIYAAAFERGFTPDSIVRDEPIRIGGDIPKNYEGGYLGRMTIRTALARSRNIPAISTFMAIGGEDPVLELGSRAGVTTPLAHKLRMRRMDPLFSYGWPMAIGSAEVPLLEMISLYATIGDHGMYQALKMICSVTDPKGTPILPTPDDTAQLAMDPQAADGVDEILRDTGRRPAGLWRRILTIPRLDTAAKTGTSDICFRRNGIGRCTEYGVNNAWTIGYSRDLVVGVWVGNTDNSVMEPLADGLTVAAPIWREFLERASRVYDAEREVCR